MKDFKFSTNWCQVDSKVLPVLCYCAEVWGMVKSEEIEKVQFQFMFAHCVGPEKVSCLPLWPEIYSWDGPQATLLVEQDER